MDEPSTTRRVHLDTLEYTRQGLRTRTPLDLAMSHHNRVVLVRPTLARVPLTAQHGFALDRAFPLPATLALLWAYRPHTSPLPPHEVPTGPRGTLQVFGHADASGDEAHNKTLSERRAAVVLALLETDVDAMLALASEDGWTPWEYQVLLRVLGSDPGPTDGDPGSLTDRAVAHFATRYRSGHFHADRPPRLPDLDAKAFNAPTVEALLDAFVHAHAPDLSGCTLHPVRPSVGCSEFNLLAPEGSRNRRVSLLTGLDDPHPENAPCTAGDPEPCAIVGEGSYGCMWYREHVHAEPEQAPALYDPRWLALPDGSYSLSVLTNLPDDAPVTFDVFGHDAPVSTQRAATDLERRLGDPLSAPSVGGVATVRWTPAADLELGPHPVFRASTKDFGAHTWANQADIIGVQILDPEGRCYSGVSLSLETPSGMLPLTTDPQGIAWLGELSDGPYAARLPSDLQLPHPAQTVTLKQPPTVADLQVERGSTIELTSGRVTRLRVLAPEAAPGYVSCHFGQGSAYPADTLVALVQQAHDALETNPDARIGLFAHTRSSGSAGDDKALTDRRARLVHAVLTADLSSLESVVHEDDWDETHYLSLVHFLGYEADDSRSLFAAFQRGYSAGHHHADNLDLGSGALEAKGDLDGPTKHALVEAFLATVGTSLPATAFASTPCMGCGGFNPPPDGDHADRLTLAVFDPDQHPAEFPCREGDAAACHVEETGGCRFFTQRVEETSLKYRWIDDAPKEEEEVLYMGARVLVHHGAQVAAAVYRAPASVECLSYAFLAPTTTSSPDHAAIPPRVHLVPRKAVINARLAKSRRLPRNAVPDGDQIFPMGGTGSGQTIRELLLDYWGLALMTIERNAVLLDRPDIEHYQPLADQALVTGTPPPIPDGPAFAAYRLLTDAEFFEAFLVSGMVAAGQVLNPFHSERYGSDFDARRFACNIYATDLIDLLPHGAWLPKVQFAHPRRVARKATRASTEPLAAVGPSGINDFLTARLGIGGEAFGWREIAGDKTTASGRRAIRDRAQALANRGTLVVLSGGSRPEVDRIGHVAVVMPDLAHLTNRERADVIHARAQTATGIEHFTWGFDEDETTRIRHSPMRSQAGGTNHHGIRGGTMVMTGLPDELRTPGYFTYDAQLDQSRGHEIERSSLR
jgi:outer membrane protein OmpA-like peptidoglycan-associated protein